jgi:hypothetical protein
MKPRARIQQETCICIRNYSISYNQMKSGLAHALNCLEAKSMKTHIATRLFQFQVWPSYLIFLDY